MKHISYFSEPLNQNFTRQIGWNQNPCATLIYCIGGLTIAFIMIKILWHLLKGPFKLKKYCHERSRTKNLLIPKEKEWVIVYGGNSQQMDLAINYFKDKKFNVCVCTDLKGEQKIIINLDKIDKVISLETKEEFETFVKECNFRILLICKYDSYTVIDSQRLPSTIENLGYLVSQIQKKASHKSVKGLIVEISFKDAFNALCISAQNFIKSYLEPSCTNYPNIVIRHMETVAIPKNFRKEFSGFMKEFI